MTIHNDPWIDIGHGIQLGKKDGHWSVCANRAFFPLVKETDFFRVITLLEFPPDQVQLKLADLNYQADFQGEFPFEIVVKSAIDSKSDHWLGNALPMLRILPIEKKVLLLDSLVELSNSKWASQKNRAIAKTEIKAIRDIQPG